MGEQIIGVRFVELPAEDGSFVWDQETLLVELDRFLHEVRSDAEADQLGRALATVLFTDIVGSTTTAADLGGLAVVIGARVGALAVSDEVLVSSTQDLTAGSGLVFEDAGEHQLKGLQDVWRLYRVIG